MPSPRRSGPARLLAAAVLVPVVAASALAAGGTDGRTGSGPPPARAGVAPARPAGAAVPAAPARRRAAEVPGSAALADARRFARDRRGTVSFAVVGTSGRLRCHACARVFRSASTAKTLLLVAHLRATRGALTRADAGALARMIRVSDNGAADAIYARVGDAGLARLARRARLRDFAPAGYWSETRTSARDQARLFARLPGLVPRRHRAFARRALRTVVPAQSWGIPAAGRPRGWRTLHKGGWRPEPGGALIHQAARLERGGRPVAIAVLTDGNPGARYGAETVRGVARRLLAPR